MKTKFTLLCLLFSVALIAQVTNLPTVLQGNDEYDAFYVVPKSLSYDGSNRVYIRTEDNQVAIYGNNFTPVKSFSITPTCTKSIRIGKSRIVTLSLASENVVYSGSELVFHYEIPMEWNEEEMKKHLEQQWGHSIISSKQHPEGGIWFFYDMEDYQGDGSDARNYYKVDVFGKKYPLEAYLWRDNYLYTDYISYIDNSEYNKVYGEWEETGEREETEDDPQLYSLGFINYDNDDPSSTWIEYGDGICLSQTLFNNDAKYEYITFPYQLEEWEPAGIHNPQGPIDQSGNYTEYRSIYFLSTYRSFNIMSEDGTVLQIVTFPTGFKMVERVHAQVIQLANECYFLCYGNINDQGTILVYKINRSSVGASVEQVCAPIKVGVYPNLVNRNQTITIQLSGDNAAKTAIDVEVVNMSGQVTDRQTISAGQTHTQIRANKFSTGMNIVNLLQNGKTIGTQRVVVK